MLGCSITRNCWCRGAFDAGATRYASRQGRVFAHTGLREPQPAHDSIAHLLHETVRVDVKCFPVEAWNLERRQNVL